MILMESKGFRIQTEAYALVMMNPKDSETDTVIAIVGLLHIGET